MKNGGRTSAAKGARGGGKSGGASGKGGDGGSQKRWFYILLAALAIAGIGTLGYMSAQSGATVAQVDTTIRPIPNQGHALGSDTALVEVLMFADFECPACGSFATLAEPDVRARLINTGLIRFRFMDLPLSIHRNTWPAHRAAWCASEQGKFWEMHDALFNNQDRWSGEATRRPDGFIAGLARQMGLNMDQYERCVSSRKYDPQIQANVDEAIRYQVSGTPTFIIGDKKVGLRRPGAYDEFKQHIDAALTQARANAQARTKAPAPTKAK